MLKISALKSQLSSYLIPMLLANYSSRDNIRESEISCIPTYLAVWMMDYHFTQAGLGPSVRRCRE